MDRRPSKILVSGFELDEKDSLVEHFAKFGEIVDTLEVRLSNFLSQIIENKTGYNTSSIHVLYFFTPCSIFLLYPDDVMCAFEKIRGLVI